MSLFISAAVIGDAAVRDLGWEVYSVLSWYKDLVQGFVASYEGHSFFVRARTLHSHPHPATFLTYHFLPDLPAWGLIWGSLLDIE